MTKMKWVEVGYNMVFFIKGSFFRFLQYRHKKGGYGVLRYTTHQEVILAVHSTTDDGTKYLHETEHMWATCLSKSTLFLFGKKAVQSNFLGGKWLFHGTIRRPHMYRYSG